MGRLGTRTPEMELRAKMVINSALYAWLPWALRSRSQDDDRICLGLIAKVNNPAEWAKWVALFFGPPLGPRPAAPPPARTRTPEEEHKVKMVIHAALAAWLPITFWTRTEDDDRICLGLMQMVSDPAEWASWADLIFGPNLAA